MKELQCVHPNAKIGSNVVIEPFAFISENVEIGDNCWIGQHATILENVKIGNNCKIYPGAVLGGEPQDTQFEGEVTYVEIGDNTIIREYVTINRGSLRTGRGVTKVGNHCMIMSYAHVAHDCIIEDNVVLTSYVGVSGVCDIGEYAIIGGQAGLHQFTKIGAHAMIGGGAVVLKDIPPYITAGNNPLSFAGINLIGLRRRGFSREKIEEISNIYKVIYNSGFNRSDACKKVEESFEETPEMRAIVNFIRGSKRGIVRGFSDSANE